MSQMLDAPTARAAAAACLGGDAQRYDGTGSPRTTLHVSLLEETAGAPHDVRDCAWRCRRGEVAGTNVDSSCGPADSEPAECRDRRGGMGVTSLGIGTTAADDAFITPRTAHDHAGSAEVRQPVAAMKWLQHLKTIDV